MRKEYEEIVRAFQRKAEAVCPDSFELIGVYGSCRTGDVHPRSDLDLLILIRDEGGRALADSFILEDLGGVSVGFDLYCTTWEALESDAACPHAHLGKLMDAEIRFSGNPGAMERLTALRQQATSILQSEERFERARALWEQAKGAYAEAMLAESLVEARMHAAAALDFGVNGLMLGHGRYFKRGVKRCFEELAELNLSHDFRALALAVVSSDTTDGLCGALTAWMRAVGAEVTAMAVPAEKEAPCKENIAGTYEEMFSNWRNKMVEACRMEDVFASFMNLASLEFMLRDVAAAVDVRRPDALASFDPKDLRGNAEAFDRALEAYEAEYARAGLVPRRFARTEDFLKVYLKEV